MIPIRCEPLSDAVFSGAIPTPVPPPGTWYMVMCTGASVDTTATGGGTGGGGGGVVVIVVVGATLVISPPTACCC